MVSMMLVDSFKNLGHFLKNVMFTQLPATVWEI